MYTRDMIFAFIGGMIGVIVASLAWSAFWMSLPKPTASLNATQQWVESHPKEAQWAIKRYEQIQTETEKKYLSTK